MKNEAEKVTKKTNIDENDIMRNDIIRPLDQNWWPVSTLSCLDLEKPNPITIFGQTLILLPVMVDDNDEYSVFTWKCFPEDMQSSSFDVKTDGKASVAEESSFPVQISAGLVWVWPSATTRPPAETPTSTGLSISPLLQRWYTQFSHDDNELSHDGGGSHDCFFVRDVLCPIDILMENFMDVARLPFVHNSLGGLDRQEARPIKMTMIEKKENNSGDGFPMFQAQVVNAWNTDPIFVASESEDILEDATSTISFYPPNHIRIERHKGGGALYSSAHIFFTPLQTSGQTRIFYSQIFGEALAEENSGAVTTAMARKLLDPSSVRNHMFLHQLMDGDLILTALRREQKNYNNKREAIVPSVDILGRAYRKEYWNPVKATTDLKGFFESSDVPPRINRRSLLDRRSHTDNCRICRKAEEKVKQLYGRLGLLRTGLIATAGAGRFFSWMILLAQNNLMKSRSHALAILQSVAMSSAVLSVVAAIIISYWRQSVQRNLQKFTFEDYVH
eukprot:CAMPEP_0194207388 /NCGR_PEP_ID=MMETSP0156-20130528/6149_1 /TAXON_ID=33649 /ORGANISM="Thalassionema nitzschioides, Strain L26-B" /LENGTH=502 /DNA_ID=CAMNT_0038934143 /DNA_START=202 /DNA_END=1707 /DNA_ORIENTATION=-